MKPSELYARTPESEIEGAAVIQEYLLGGYSRFCHVPELEYLKHFRPVEAAERVSVRVHKHFDFDCRRFWRLASVWFDAKPVMVICNAGREGDDYAESYVTDPAAYRAMVAHIATRFAPKEEPVSCAADPDDDVAMLTDFYGNRLDGPFAKTAY